MDALGVQPADRRRAAERRGRARRAAVRLGARPKLLLNVRWRLCGEWRWRSSGENDPFTRSRRHGEETKTLFTAPHSYKPWGAACTWVACRQLVGSPMF
eukprot:366438-Chlamydomonas_euryale.AAC.19